LNSPSEESENPFWKRLFSPGGFEWAFRMRKGDAKSFFARQDESGELLLKRSRQLEESFERYSACTEEGENLVEEAWDLALEWEQVVSKEPRNLKLLSEQWEADLLFMDRQTSQVAAGSVCFPSSWDLRHAIGKTLDQVHGVVPRLNPQIGEMIKRFLEKLEPGKSYCRENWSFTRSDALDYHPDLNRKRLDETLSLDEVYLRIEHQLFTGLSGGVLMGIRIETTPLKELAENMEVWKTLREKLETMPDDVARYKSMDAAIPTMLREMEKFCPV
jgi:hypothetical protein